MTSPRDELVEVVDEAGAVVGIVTRAEMRARNLRHRSTFVVVRTSAGAIVAHRRSEDKDVWPGLWDLAFGGVAGVGEPWREAACRELAEEAGVTVEPADLVDLVAGSYTDARVSAVSRAFTVVHDGPYTCPDGEVVELALVPLRLLPDWLTEHRLCPDTWSTLVPALLELPTGP